MLDCLALALVLSTSSQTPPSERPAAPYSLPPASGRARPGQAAAPSLVAPNAPAPEPSPVSFADDGVPLPRKREAREEAGGDVVAAPAGGDPFFLGFAAGAHHPPAGEAVDAELRANALSSYADGRPTQATYAFVMFARRMTPERLAQLEALGCRLLGFHPHYAQKVAIPAAALDAVAALDFVRWVGVPRTWQKVHPELQRHLAEAPPNQPVDVWVSVFESDLDPASVPVESSLTSLVSPGGAVAPGDAAPVRHVFVSNGWQQRALERAGLEVVDFHERASVFRARMMPQGLDLVTALDFVQFVERDMPMELFHDESTPLVNADDVRSFHPGGDTAIAGIVDTGVNGGHSDISAYMIFTNLSGSPGTVWEDQCGHGTHVAGTMLGQGNVEPGHRGVAPELGTDPNRPLYNARVFADCSPQSVNVPMVLSFLTPSTKKPHVVNDSWGSESAPGSPWIGSETDARLCDDAAYYDAQLHVFAAGNWGPGASSIGLPAVAKNVLTVGNVTDYDDSYGLAEVAEVWTGSSRGPCGDGRWKPNLSAPGRWITSADAFDLNGYVTLSGTSMAAPHVTGLAADLLDADPSLAYLPEGISSLLMATATRKNGAGISSPGDPALDIYGTGRADGTTAIWDSSKGARSQWKFSLAPGVSTYAAFDVPVGATRLVAVMHYVERSASAGASTALVNDFDLWLDQPPLTANSNTGEWWAQQSAVDNTEIRTLNDPVPGTWNWKVHPESTSSTAYFGVTIFVETGDTTPALSPTLTSTAQNAQPFYPVRFDYALTTPGMPLSAVFLEASATSPAVLADAHTYLKDGPETGLLNNLHSGWDLSLGDVHPLFSRNASWEVYWTSEGLKSLCVRTSSDNASNSGTTTCDSVVIDGTPPYIASLTSTSHTGQWSNDPTADLQWSAIDPLSALVAAGIAGYGHTITAGSASTPPAVLTLGPVSNLTTSPLSDGVHWFNLRPVDSAANWGGSSSLELKIDTSAPNGITGLASTTHQVGVSSCDPTVTLTWDPAVDNGPSGIAGYGVAFAPGASGTAPYVVNATGAPYSFTPPSSTLPWYCHVRAIDQAGNGGPQATIGPFPIDADPASTYCTAKPNSLGCVPAMTWSGAPRLSGSDFTAIGTGVLNNKIGLLFWGHAPSSSAFQGGTKCVAAPTKRTPTQSSGGNPPPDDCSGTYGFTFDSAYMNANGIGVGDTVYCQYWSRDPSAPWTTGLTDGLSFTVCP